MRRIPEEHRDGLPQPGGKHYTSYIERMRALLNTHIAAITPDSRNPVPVPLHTIVAYRFIPRHDKKGIRLEVRLEDNSTTALDINRYYMKVVEQGFLPDPRQVDPRDVRWDGHWNAYYPEQWAIPYIPLTSR